MAKTLALVTGSNQGIGKSVAEILARKHGYHVLIGARNVEGGEAAAAGIRESGHDAEFIHLDLASKESIDKAVATITEKFGYIDVIVNNGAVILDKGNTLSTWDLHLQTFTINSVGLVHLTESLLPLLRKFKNGPPRIVNVSSIMASMAVSQDPSTPFYIYDLKAYDASKAAVNIYTINYARILKDIGGKVNSVCPGYVGTRMNDYSPDGKTPDQGAERLVELATLGPDGPTGTFSNSEGKIEW